ncbi:helix-turn-helix transcriptional regulator [Streptococcus suis]|uniref:Helix-turn-helix domain-containing protein n=1 Tax=Streptococcus suis TaxID=1307 RepID=A0A0Z8V922_STRSU|nr:helix-turn-helix transcriptional regulator [Streptococcus suis]MCK3957787.1 helix-turn-helix domain-containing protein [Streptococcus suis]MCK4004643.1 helix-turn-helix domain-containing protein [Streptococcus suis]NQG65293.1 helix-turn-helix domain-containing protein [Streptococcus suis]NQG67209.1 helix-turn-helix domain-containing protein [Streptococcus suis]NQH54505.1 helix-turn-helix domain-containing protein [Streptococcus suis]
MNRLKELRKERGLTQQELAQEIGTTKLTISNWENEKHAIGSEKAKLLADSFNVSVGYLLGHSEYRDSQEASYQLNQIDPSDPYNHVKARIYSLLGDSLLEELERQYVTGYYSDDPDFSRLVSFLSAVNQLSYMPEEEMLLNYGILSQDDKMIINNLVADMAEKVKKENQKKPWENKF